MAFGIAVLGLDHWYTAFGVLDICSNSPETPLVSIYEPDAGRRAEVAAAYPEVFVTDSAEAALSAPGVELVAICARTGDAVSLSRQALLARKHVISVKPFARTADEANDLLSVAAKTDRFFGSFEGMQRLSPRAEKLKELIEADAIGQVVAFHQVGHGPLPAPWRGAKNGGASWWLDADQVPGGAWIDHAIYAIDLARFALDGEVTQATGVLDNRVHKNLAVEDYGAAILNLKRRNGADVTLYITDTWCAEPGTGYSEYRFLGTEGTITAGGNTWVVQTKTGTTRHDLETGKYFRFDKLATLLQDKRKPPFGSHDAEANLAACLRIYGR